jgi:endonuclease G
VKKEIGKGRIEVAVPKQLWKVIMVLPHADAEPTRATRTIAVIMPNTQEVGYDWAKYRVSVTEVEKLTRYKFWGALPEDLAKDLKSTADEVKIREPRPTKKGRD